MMIRRIPLICAVSVIFVYNYSATVFAQADIDIEIAKQRKANADLRDNIAELKDAKEKSYKKLQLRYFSINTEINQPKYDSVRSLLYKRWKEEDRQIAELRDSINLLMQAKKDLDKQEELKRKIATVISEAYNLEQNIKEKSSSNILLQKQIDSLLASAKNLNPQIVSKDGVMDWDSLLTFFKPTKKSDRISLIDSAIIYTHKDKYEFISQTLQNNIITPIDIKAVLAIISEIRDDYGLANDSYFLMAEQVRAENISRFFRYKSFMLDTFLNSQYTVDGRVKAIVLSAKVISENNWLPASLVTEYEELLQRSIKYCSFSKNVFDFLEKNTPWAGDLKLLLSRAELDGLDGYPYLKREISNKFKTPLFADFIYKGKMIVSCDYDYQLNVYKDDE